MSGLERERANKQETTLKAKYRNTAKNDTDLKVLMHRVNESSIIDGNNSNEHLIYLLYQSE